MQRPHVKAGVSCLGPCYEGVVSLGSQGLLRSPAAFETAMPTRSVAVFQIHQKRQ